MTDAQTDAQKAAKIRELNDAFRKDPRSARHGRVYVTGGIDALHTATKLGIVKAIREFDQFDDGNDPWREHDFGKVTVGDVSAFWRIEYYDSRGRDMGSEDPTDPEKTLRVMTIMLPEEY